MKRFIAAIVAAPLCVFAAQAQTLPPVAGGEVLTLEEALAEAGRRSPNPVAAEAGVRSAEAARAVAGLYPNPSNSVDTENAIGTGPYRGFGESDTTVAFAMPVELGGKRSARLGMDAVLTDAGFPGWFARCREHAQELRQRLLLLLGPERVLWSAVGFSTRPTTAATGAPDLSSQPSQPTL